MNYGLCKSCKRQDTVFRNTATLWNGGAEMRNTAGGKDNIEVDMEVQKGSNSYLWTP